jgi:GAF domain-containing protein
VRRRRDLVADVVRSLGHVEETAATLGRVARACIPELAECCMVDVMRPDGGVECVEAVHVDPGQVEMMAHLKEQYAPRAGHPVLDVFTSSRPVIMDEVGPAALARMAADPTHLALLRRFGPKSLMALPVTVGGETIAVFTFAITDSSRRYDRADLQFAQEIVGRVAEVLGDRSRGS